MAAQFLLWFLIGLCCAITLFNLILTQLWVVLSGVILGLLAAVCFKAKRLLIVACLSGFVSGVVRVMFPQPLAMDNQIFTVTNDLLNQFGLRLNSVFQNIFPEPVSGFGQGIITGGQGVRFSDDFYEALRLTSTLHLIAVSGYNVSIIGRYIKNIMIWIGLNRKWVWLASLVSIWLFIIFVGTPASAVRAGIMVSLFMVAERFGRVGQSWRVLIYAAALMMFHDPGIVSDLGFQLSVMATGGIVVSSLTNGGKDGFRGVLRETLWAQAMVFPLIAYRFGTVTILGLAANLILIPLMPVLMMASAVPAMVGMVGLVLGKVLAVMVLPILWSAVKIIEFGASVPLAGVSVPEFSPLLLLLYYGFLGFYIYYRQKHPVMHA